MRRTKQQAEDDARLREFLRANDVEPRGDISAAHTVWCCTARRAGGTMPFASPTCHGHLSVAGDRLLTFKVARAARWVDTPVFGYLCPPCVDAHRAMLQAMFPSTRRRRGQ